MKIKFLMAGLLGLVSTTVFAQKGELSKAKEEFEKAEALRGNALGAASLNTAKTSIDKASANAKTASLPETYALKGAIYASLAAQDTVMATSQPLFNTADEALKKAKELDVKGESARFIQNGNISLSQWMLNKGVKEYREKKFDLAYKSFDYYRQALPDDTNAMYYTALSASASGNYPAAITSYKKLTTVKFSQNPVVYFDLSSIYLVTKDTLSALKTVSEGIEKYPTSAELRKREIEISLQTGRQQEVVGKIQAAITNDPKNKNLYYYAGLTQGQFAEAVAKEITKTKDAIKKAALLKQKTDFFNKAAEMYKKALEIDPEFFEAALNMGYVTISPAIDMYNAANQIPGNKQKEYDAAIAKSKEQFELSKPYLLKSVELQPKSIDALNNLKMYYLGTKDTAHANEIQKRIDAVK
jgi:hypothetical protein